MPWGKAAGRSAAALSVCLLMGCGGVPWPDEPGVPVALSQADNVQAGDTFLATLTAERQAAGRAPPLVTPRLQTEVRDAAEKLQAGTTSAARIRRALVDWGKAAYHHEVDVWLVDCGGDGPPRIPAALVDVPAAVISYAAVHFRPRSLAADQCAILLVASGGSEAVVEQTVQ